MNLVLEKWHESGFFLGDLHRLYKNRDALDLLDLDRRSLRNKVTFRQNIDAMPVEHGGAAGTQIGKGRAHASGVEADGAGHRGWGGDGVQAKRLEQNGFRKKSCSQQDRTKSTKETKGKVDGGEVQLGHAWDGWIGGISVDHGVERREQDQGEAQERRDQSSREKKEFHDQKRNSQKQKQGVLIAGQSRDVVAKKKHEGANPAKNPE